MPPPARILRAALAANKDLVRDHRAVQKILADEFPDRPPEAVLLHVACRVGVAFDLSQAGTAAGLRQRQWERRLVDQAGLSLGAARRALTLWRQALDIAPGSSADEHAGPRARGPAAACRPIGGGKRLEGHRGPLQQLAFSPDGTLIYGIGHARSLRLWSSGNGQQVDVAFRGHASAITTMAVSAQVVVTGDEAGFLREWTPAAKRGISWPAHRQSIQALGWHGSDLHSATSTETAVWRHGERTSTLARDNTVGLLGPYNLNAAGLCDHQGHPIRPDATCAGGTGPVAVGGTFGAEVIDPKRPEQRRVFARRPVDVVTTAPEGRLVAAAAGAVVSTYWDSHRTWQADLAVDVRHLALSASRMAVVLQDGTGWLYRMGAG
jgi:WD40 repeat protein